MKHLIRLLFAIALLAAFVGCEPAHPRHRIQHKTKTVAVHHLPDGRYVYQDDNGVFWFYMYMMHSSGNTTSSYYSGSSSTPPRGGAWTSANISPEETKTLEQSVASTPAVEEPIAVQENGQPLSEAQVESEGRDGVDVAEGPESSQPDSPSEPSTPDSGPDSGGSGGGGDSGGGGGDSGGGGE